MNPLTVADHSHPTERLGPGCDQCGGAAERGGREHLRCACGSLLARKVPEGVELKCRRCKRTVVIPLQMEEPQPAS